MKEKKNLLKNNAVQSLIASLLCIVFGLLLGYIVLLFINPTGAGEAIMAVVKNFWNYSRANLQAKNFGNTLVKTAPLLMCALSVLFAYKVGLFNIGVAGQYVVGSCACLYAALAWHWSWLPCLLFALVIGGA
ncbi:MAG: ABC transporter permease, partial [Oscillospiraceae bacterium]|nr:ABC transporter permease [Oscillospiraceae bacterium]